MRAPNFARFRPVLPLDSPRKMGNQASNRSLWIALRGSKSSEKIRFVFILMEETFLKKHDAYYYKGCILLFQNHCFGTIEGAPGLFPAGAAGNIDIWGPLRYTGTVAKFIIFKG